MQYLQYASENAIQRSAHKEACKQLSKGLELLKTWPDSWVYSRNSYASSLSGHTSEFSEDGLMQRLSASIREHGS